MSTVANADLFIEKTCLEVDRFLKNKIKPRAFYFCGKLNFRALSSSAMTPLTPSVSATTSWTTTTGTQRNTLNIR